MGQRKDTGFLGHIRKSSKRERRCCGYCQRHICVTKDGRLLRHYEGERGIPCRASYEHLSTQSDYLSFFLPLRLIP